MTLLHDGDYLADQIPDVVEIFATPLVLIIGTIQFRTIVLENFTS